MPGIEESWKDVNIKLGIRPRPTPTEAPKKEISLTTIIIGGILVWLLIFGALFGWAAVQPCSFLQFIIGAEGIQDFRARGIDVSNTEVCRTILRGGVR